MKNPYFKKALQVLLLFFIFIVLTRELIYLVVDEHNAAIIIFFQGLIKFILLIITIYLIKKEPFFDLNYLSKNKIKSLSIAVLLIVYSLYSTFNKIDNLKINVSFFVHASYFFQCICTGFFEEYFFRCLIFGYICYGFMINTGGEPKHNYKQVMITSFLFAIVHSSNFFNKEYDSLSVINQIMFAFIMGILLQCIFYINNNIFFNAILHAMINYNSMLSHKLFHNEVASNENSGLNDFLQTLLTFFILSIVIVFPFLIFSLKRKKNLLIQYIK